MSKNNETKNIKTEIVINDASLLTSFEKQDGKYTVGKTKLIINITNIFQFKEAINRVCQEIQSECDNLNKIEAGKPSAVDILRAINNVSDQKCKGDCANCQCEDDTPVVTTSNYKAQVLETKNLFKNLFKNPSVVKGTNSPGLSGIVETKNYPDASDYCIVGGEKVEDFSDILNALQSYVAKRNTVTFRQISKAFYDRTRNFCKQNNISEEGFTMDDWKELFDKKKTEIMTKYGLYVNSMGCVTFTYVGKFVKPAVSISG